MKRSGMHWRADGGQAILTLRALAQSDRFERGGAMLAAAYKRQLVVPDNVVSINSVRKRPAVSM